MRGFKLEEEQLLLGAGKGRWLARASREVEVVLEEINKSELRRAVEVDQLAEQLQIPSAPSLSSLAEAVDEPWRGIFREHRRAFRTLTDQISTLAEANRAAISADYRDSYDALRALGASEAEIDPAAGVPASAGCDPQLRLVDGAR